MKKSNFAFVAAVFASVQLAPGAAFVSDLSGLNPGAPGDALDGYVDGGSAWTQSESNPGGGPLASGIGVTTGAGTQNGFVVGCFYDVPAANSFSVSHSANTSFGGSALLTTLVLTDSTAGFPDRNDYTIGIYNSSNALLFGLNLNAADPTAPGGANDVWNVDWASSGGTSTGAFGGLIEDGVYDITAIFVTNGANVDFSLSIVGANTVTTSGTLTGLAGQAVTSYRVGTSIGGGADWGDGGIAITGVAIPEPSSTIFLALGALGLIRRRR